MTNNVLQHRHFDLRQTINFAVEPIENDDLDGERLGGAGTIAGTMPRSSMFAFLAGILSDPAFGLLLHGREMQTPGWLPVIVQDIDLAARLRSNGRSRTRRIPGMAAPSAM